MDNATWDAVKTIIMGILSLITLFFARQAHQEVRSVGAKLALKEEADVARSEVMMQRINEAGVTASREQRKRE